MIFRWNRLFMTRFYIAEVQSHRLLFFLSYCRKEFICKNEITIPGLLRRMERP